MKPSSTPISAEVRAERERIWRYARFGYLFVYLLLLGGILLSGAAVVSLLGKLYSH